MKSPEELARDLSFYFEEKGVGASESLKISACFIGLYGSVLLDPDEFLEILSISKKIYEERYPLKKEE